MERKNVSQKLNEIYTQYCEKNPRLFPLARFYQGETKRKLYEIACSLAPHGKAVALFSANCDKALVNEITDGLRGACAKILSVKIAEKSDVVSAAAQAVAAAEDARIIVVAEYSLLPLARYVAKIAGHPLVYVMRTGEADGILAPRLFLKNGNRADCFFSDVRTRVIIDADKICAGRDGAFAEKKVAASIFARIAAKIPALTDYKARILATGEKPNAEAFGLLRTAVKDGYKAFTKKDGEILPSLIYDSFLAEIADLISGGDLYSFSAIRFAEFLLAGEKRLSAAQVLELYARISGIYALYTSPLADGLLETPDYRERAHELAELTGTDEGVFLKGLLKQAEILNAFRENADNITDKFFDELSKQNASAVSVRSTFTAYGAEGGNETQNFGERLKKAIKLAGDSPFMINAMSFAREKGVTEFI